MDGRYVPSLLAAIGDVIEQHMLRIGFISHDETGPGTGDLERLPVAAVQRLGSERLESEVADAPQGGAHHGQGPVIHDHLAGVAGARVCPQCGERALRRVEGCWTCANCTYSRCG
jgi:ribonucleoside-diphosphate reductase alpha chain